MYALVSKRDFKMASLYSDFQNAGVLKVTKYNGAEGDHFLVGFPMEMQVEGVEGNSDSNMELLMFSESDEIVPQPVEVVIDGCGDGSNSFDYTDQENITESEVYLQQSPSDIIIETEVRSEQSPLLCNRKGKDIRRNGSRSKCKRGPTSNNESRRINSQLSYFNGDYSLHGWPSDEVKKESFIDGVEEEVTTCSLASSSNDFDTMSWPRSSGDSLSGIDLCDPRQLSEFARSKQSNSLVEQEKTVSCTHPGCGKMFKDNATMRKHNHTHGPKTFTCVECGKSFVESSKLKRHHLVHTGEKSFQCKYPGCNKRFSLDFNLRTHNRIHTGERPFSCPFDGCTKRFAQSTNLKSHILTHGKQKSPRLKRFDFDEGNSWLPDYDN